MIDVKEYNDNTYKRLSEFTQGVSALLKKRVVLKQVRSKSLKLEWEVQGNTGVIYITRALVNRVNKVGTKAVEIMILHQLVHIAYNDDTVYEQIRDLDREDESLGKIASVLLDVRADIESANLLKQLYGLEEIDMKTLMEFRKLNEGKMNDVNTFFKKGQMPARDRIKIIHSAKLNKQLLLSICQDYYRQKGISVNEITVYKAMSYIFEDKGKHVNKSSDSLDKKHSRNKNVQ